MGISPSLSLSQVVVLPTNFLAQLSPSPPLRLLRRHDAPATARRRPPAVRALVRPRPMRASVCVSKGSGSATGENLTLGIPDSIFDMRSIH